MRRTVTRRIHQRLEDGLASDILHPCLTEFVFDEIERCVALGEDVRNSLRQQIHPPETVGGLGPVVLMVEAATKHGAIAQDRRF